MRSDADVLLTTQAVSSSGGGYALEPATVTIQGDEGITASTLTVTSTATFQDSVLTRSVQIFPDPTFGFGGYVHFVRTAEVFSSYGPYRIVVSSQASLPSTTSPSQSNLTFYPPGNATYPTGAIQFGFGNNSAILMEPTSVTIDGLLSPDGGVADGTLEEADIGDLAHTTDTGPSPDCSGETTYQDGEGNCDNLSLVYQPLDATLTDLAAAPLGEADSISVGAIAAGTLSSDVLASSITSNSVGAAQLSATAIQAGDFPAAGIDGDDINSNLAGRSLSLTSGSPDVLNIDAEIYTEQFTIYIATPVADDDYKSVFCTITSTYTITAMRCESDGTVNMDLQVDDGSPADVNGSDLACDSTPPTDSSMGGDATLSAGECLDVAITSVSSDPTYVSFTFEATKND